MRLCRRSIGTSASGRLATDVAQLVSRYPVDLSSSDRKNFFFEAGVRSVKELVSA